MQSMKSYTYTFLSFNFIYIDKQASCKVNMIVSLIGKEKLHKIPAKLLNYHIPYIYKRDDEEAWRLKPTFPSWPALDTCRKGLRELRAMACTTIWE